MSIYKKNCLISHYTHKHLPSHLLGIRSSAIIENIFHSYVHAECLFFTL